MAITIPTIELANVVPGATLLGAENKGVNETFVGSIDTVSGRYRAYIKVLGGRQLVNELLSSTVGRAVGLPIPQGYLLKVFPSDLPDSVVLKKQNGEVLAFGTRDVGQPSLKRRIKKDGNSVLSVLFRDWKEWDEAVIFDDWIANVDRNPGNLLIGSPGEVWLIDHGHSFTGPEWKEADLIPDKIFPNKLGDLHFSTLTLPERMGVREKAGNLSLNFGLVDPDAALSASITDKLLSVSELKAIKDFLRLRVAKLIDIVSSRLGIPNMGA